jgi:hypothetical protein
MFFNFNLLRLRGRSLRFEVSALKFNGGLLFGAPTSFLLKNDSIVLYFDMLDEPKFFKLNYYPIRDNQS